jgi:phosphoglycolate phosphatase
MDEIEIPQDISLDGYTIAFDLDGTLVDTAPDLVAALNFSLETAGFAAVEPAIVQGQIGLGSIAMIRTGLAAQNVDIDEAELNQLREKFLGYYAENTATYSQPYPGALDALDRLEDAGAIAAICTNKPQKLADILLEELKLHARFSAIVGSDSVPQRKPHPEHIMHTLGLAGGTPDMAIMIGDSTPDEKAARAAGLPFIFVPFGYGPIGPAHDNRIELEAYSKLDSEFILSLF